MAKAYSNNSIETRREAWKKKTLMQPYSMLIIFYYSADRIAYLRCSYDHFFFAFLSSLSLSLSFSFYLCIFCVFAFPFNNNALCEVVTIVILRMKLIAIGWPQPKQLNGSYILFGCPSEFETYTSGTLASDWWLVVARSLAAAAVVYCCRCSTIRTTQTFIQT